MIGDALRFARYRRAAKIAGVVAGLFVLIYLGLHASLRSPSFCRTCHYMKPYYEQWKASTHNETSCVRCHPSYTPGTFLVSALKYATGLHNPRPLANVPDASCQAAGCHTEDDLHKPTLFKGSMPFSHKDHMHVRKRGEQLACASCHSTIVQGDHLAVQEDVCFLCHFKGAPQGTSITGCPSCHGTPTKIVEHAGFSFSHESYLKIGVACNQCHLDVARGAGDVPKERCYSCHVERLAEYENFKLIHDTHVTARGVRCLSCHTRIEHGEFSMIQALEVRCENCHSKLHSAQKELYLGTSGHGVPDTPSRMFAAQVSCDGCHIDAEGRTATPAARRRSCVACHGRGYDSMLDDWIRSGRTMTDAVGPYVARVGASLKSARGIKPAVLGQAQDLFSAADNNYRLVRDGKAAHNVEYAVKLLRETISLLESVSRSVKSPIDIKSQMPAVLTNESAYCRELCHNSMGVPETLFFDEMRHDFPHSLHAVDMELECTTCHSPEKHKQRIITKEGCMQCHHQGGDAPLACERCHVQQAALFKSTLRALGVKPVTAEMADMACTDCHDLSKDESLAELKQKCVDCHGDEGYGEMAVSWEKEIEASYARLTLAIANAREKLDRDEAAGADVSDRRKAVAEVERAVEAVKAGRAVHNFGYATSVLEAAGKRLVEMR